MTAIAERYARAIKSSHLELKVEAGDIDTLIAAGMADSLGTSLLRLRFEYDSISCLPGKVRLRPMLNSAAVVRGHLLDFVAAEVERKSFEIDLNRLTVIIARVLDLWIDPSCPSCGGRGAVGEYGKPQMLCGVCGGSKLRRLLWPENEELLVGWLTSQLESKVDTAIRRIQKLLRN